MLSQLLINGLISGCAYALVALGFALIYNTTRTFHFAHGAVYTISAYIFYELTIIWQVSLLVAAAITLVFSALIGILIDKIVYLPLVSRKSSQLIRMLSSLGVYIVLVNIVSMRYGDETKKLSPEGIPSYVLGDILLTNSQLITALSFVIFFTLLFIALRWTQLGKLIRGMRDDCTLIGIMGINSNNIRLIVFALGSMLAGAAAIVTGLQVDIDPHIGMAATLAGAVSVIIGGVGIFEGAAFGGLILGILQSLAVWQISGRWQETITFVVLILFLLVRPKGILGNNHRIEEES